MIVARYFIIPSIHPLLPLTIAFIFGITAQQYIPFPFHHPFYAALCILLGLCALEIKSTRKLYVLAFLFFIFGIHLLSLQKSQFENFYQKWTGLCSIRAKVGSLEPIQHEHFLYRTILQLREIKLINQTWKKETGSIVLFTRKKPGAKRGDYIEIEQIKIKQPVGEYAQFLTKEQFCTSICLPAITMRIIAPARSSLRNALDQLRLDLLLKLKHRLSRTTFALVSSIFLGNRTLVKKDMDCTKDDFKHWGISHYLARSGLHVVLFIMLWYFLLSLLPVGHLIKQLLLITLILMYCLLSWNSVSFERAVLMFLLSKAIGLLGYPGHYIHIITLATLIILVLNPMQLFFLDFQLSFGFTFALAWFGYVEAEKKRVKSVNT